MKLEDFIRAIPDFPKKGILFRDITTLLNQPQAFKTSINQMAKLLKNKMELTMEPLQTTARYISTSGC